MDKSIPAPAAHILDFIRETEVGSSGRQSYDVIFGHNQGQLPIPITEMKIDDVIDAQRSFTIRYGSSATGAYQFMRRTLRGLKRELSLSGSQVMEPDLQDRLAYHLLKRRSYEAWVIHNIGDEGFAKRLAMEWASLPVLTKTDGENREIERGESYYAGDVLNSALVSAKKVEETLENAKQLSASASII